MAEDSERNHQTPSNRSRETHQRAVGRRAFLTIAGTAAAAAYSGGSVAASEENESGDGDGDTAGDSSSGSATPDVFIAPNGNDSTGDGSADNPWFTIERAANDVSAGDTIAVQDGTYEYGSDGQVISTSEITIRAADGASPTMVWSGGAIGWENTATEGLLVESADNVTISGIELTESHSWGLHLKDSHNCTVRGVDTHHNGGMGMGITHGGSNTLITNCDAHHNGTESTAETADGIVLNGASGDITGTVVENCQVYTNVEDGVDCYQGSGITVRNCRAWDNGRPNSETPESSAMGMGFKMGGGEHDGNNHIEQSAAWGNHYTGIADNISSGSVTVWNCTCWNNGQSNFEFTGNDDEVVNCISYEGEVFPDAGTTERHNSWNLGITDPQFRSVDPANQETAFRLDEDSPCIDAGIDVGLDYTGDAPNLGASE